MIISVGDKYIVQVPRFLIRPYTIPATGIVLKKVFNLSVVLLEEVAFPKEYSIYMEEKDLLDSGVGWYFARDLFNRTPILKYAEETLFDLNDFNMYSMIKKSVDEMRELDEEAY